MRPADAASARPPWPAAAPPAAAPAAAADALLAQACSLISHASPDVRQTALRVLAAAAHQEAASQQHATDAADAAFQRLCGVAAMDPLPALRVEALQAVSGLHHASTAVKLQAISKRATLRVAVPSAGDSGGRELAGGSGSSSSSRRQQQLLGDAAAIDAATGAFVHGAEDDLPRVRMAAVAALVSLANGDPLLPDAAALLLSDLASDEVLGVRLAALQALLAWASAFQQARQQQRQQQQQHDQLGEAQLSGPEPADGGGEIEADQAPAQQQPQQQENKRRGSKPRKGDLPAWGKEAQAAALTSLTDAAAAVRRLGLALLPVLPPANTPVLISMLQGLAACCSRFPQLHDGEALAVAEQVAMQRAELVSLSPAKLAPELARVLASAETGSCGREAAAAAGAAASTASGDCLPVAAQLLTRVMLIGVQARAQGLPALWRELGKAGLDKAPTLQPWLQQLHQLQPPQQQQQPGD